MMQEIRLRAMLAIHSARRTVTMTWTADNVLNCSRGPGGTTTVRPSHVIRRRHRVVELAWPTQLTQESRNETKTVAVVGSEYRNTTEERITTCIGFICSLPVK